MTNSAACLKGGTHHGVVLDTSIQGFDSRSVAFGSVFVDQDDSNIFLLFYSGAADVRWSHAAIGLATSRNGLDFEKASNNPVLEGGPKSFCLKEALTPAATRINNRFYMVFSGRPSPKSSRRLGMAYADDPKGPWCIMGELIKPACLWEGRHIDNGPSIVKLDNETILVFYSNVTTPSRFDIPAFLRRYPIRRVGILKVRIRGTSISGVEAHRFQGNPLKHLNGPKGNWNESVFCPGYIELCGSHLLLPATSTYSTGFPYKQYIGIVADDSSYFNKTTVHVEKLIDGPSEKSLILPRIKSEMGLDSPAPLINSESDKLFLFYSCVDFADGVWKIALTTFDLVNHDL